MCEDEWEDECEDEREDEWEETHVTALELLLERINDTPTSLYISYFRSGSLMKGLRLESSLHTHTYTHARMHAHIHTYT